MPQKLQHIPRDECGPGINSLSRDAESDESPECERHPDQVQDLIGAVLVSKQVIMKKTLDHRGARIELKTGGRLSRIVEKRYLICYGHCLSVNDFISINQSGLWFQES